jgi:hypothetical protein
LHRIFDLRILHLWASILQINRSHAQFGRITPRFGRCDSLITIECKMRWWMNMVFPFLRNGHSRHLDIRT